MVDEIMSLLVRDSRAAEMTEDERMAVRGAIDRVLSRVGESMSGRATIIRAVIAAELSDGDSEHATTTHYLSGKTDALAEASSAITKDCIPF